MGSWLTIGGTLRRLSLSCSLALAAIVIMELSIDSSPLSFPPHNKILNDSSLHTVLLLFLPHVHTYSDMSLGKPYLLQRFPLDSCRWATARCLIILLCLDSAKAIRNENNYLPLVIVLSKLLKCVFKPCRLIGVHNSSLSPWTGDPGKCYTSHLSLSYRGWISSVNAGNSQLLHSGISLPLQHTQTRPTGRSEEDGQKRRLVEWLKIQKGKEVTCTQC